MEIYQNLSLEDLPNEVWKDVPQWEETHEVSNLGRIRAKGGKRKWETYIRTQKPRVLAQYKKENGYLSLHLSSDNSFKNAYAHRIVAEAFIGTIGEGKEVNHLDKNKTNNRVDNLEICSRKENMAYSKDDIFEVQAKKVYRYALDGSFDKEYRSLTEASQENKVTPSCIVRACKGGRNLANNYYFRYDKCDRIDIPPKKYKKVIATNIDGNIIEFSSGFEAAAYFGVKYNSIVTACVKHTRCKGYSLNYKNNGRK